MSIIYCEKCQKHIDTDFDAEHEEECGKEELLEDKLGSDVYHGTKTKIK